MRVAGRVLLLRLDGELGEPLELVLVEPELALVEEEALVADVGYIRGLLIGPFVALLALPGAWIRYIRHTRVSMRVCGLFESVTWGSV